MKIESTNQKTIVEADFDQLPSHIDQIKCPKCGKIQVAKVIHALPNHLYHHECINCFYIIHQQDWQSIL